MFTLAHMAFNTVQDSQHPDTSAKTLHRPSKRYKLTDCFSLPIHSPETDVSASTSLSSIKSTFPEETTPQQCEQTVYSEDSKKGDYTSTPTQ